MAQHLKPRQLNQQRSIQQRSFQASARHVTSLTSLGVGAVIVILVVACSPSHDRTPIRPEALSSMQLAVNSCAEKLRSSEKLKPNTARTVNLCEFPLSQASDLRAVEHLPLKLVATANAVRYSVQKDESQSERNIKHFNLAMSVDLESLTKLEEKEQDRLMAEFSNECVTATEKIFSRSRFQNGPGISLALSVRVVSGGLNLADETVSATPAGSNVSVAKSPLSPPESISSDEPDQSLRIVKTTQDGDAFYVFEQLSSQPKFYPIGLMADAQKCRDNGGTLAAQRACVYEKIRQANRPACAAFAKRVGQILGLVDTANEQKLCNAEPPSPTGKHVSRPLLDSTFSKPSASDGDFLDHASLNQKDLVTILAPTCPALNDF